MESRSLIQELTFSYRIIQALLDGIDAEEARIQPDAESWSILEVVCHLLDEEREDFREHLDFILHGQQDRTWHRIDPQGWVKERHYNQRDWQEMKDGFAAERRASLEWLESLSAEDWDTRFVSEFGEFTAGDMLASWVAHDNLHIRQLVELRRLHIERLTKPYNIAYAGDW